MRKLLIQRYALVLSFCMSGLITAEVLADNQGVQSGYAAAGRLELRVNEEKKRQDYVVVDRRSGVEYSVLDAADVNLDQHLGRLVGVAGSVRMRADRRSGVIRATRIAQLPKEPSVLNDPADADTAEEVSLPEVTGEAEDDRDATLPRLTDTEELEEELLAPGEPLPRLRGGFDDYLGNDQYATDPNSYDSPLAWSSYGHVGHRPGHGWWFRAEYLLWDHAGMNLPPLVTTSVVGTPTNEAGALGERDTVILYGNDEILDGPRSGLRLRFGKALGCEQKWGVEFEIFKFKNQVSTYRTGAEEIIARPFLNLAPLVLPVRQDVQLVRYPGVADGSVQIDARSEFSGYGVWLRHNICGSCGVCGSGACGDCAPVPGWRVDVVGGYRYLRLNEEITIFEDLTTSSDAFSIRDDFRGKNEFHGLDVGCIVSTCHGRLAVEFLGRVAVGSSRQVVDIYGQTVTNPGQPSQQVFSGGILALRSNSGTYKRDDLAVVPELGVNVAYQLNERWSASVGYSFLYWSRVSRPGDHIDLALNPDLFPPETTPTTGPLLPVFESQPTHYYAHGLTLGLEYRL